MKIINITNDESVNVNGTGLQGYVNTTYADIVAAFGEPTYTHGDKTNVEWNLEFVIKLQDNINLISMPTMDFIEKSRLDFLNVYNYLDQLKNEKFYNIVLSQEIEKKK